MNNQEIAINMEIDESTDTISISGFSEPIVVNVRGDVDFTKLVESLEILIDKNKEIKLNVPELLPFNEKIQLVANTIIEVVNAYNTSIKPTELEDESIKLEPVGETANPEAIIDIVEDIF